MNTISLNAVALRPPEPPAPPPMAGDIQAFLDWLHLERGASKNTINAYGSDLRHFARWAVAGGLADCLRPTYHELLNYLERLHDEGLASASQARKVAALRMFFRYLRMDERTKAESAELLESPICWEHLPAYLNERKIVKLITAPREVDRWFSRDRAIMETLYATGCRATELCAMRLDNLDLAEGQVKLDGKGRKERIVPIGRPACEAIAHYLAQLRPHLARRSPAAEVFLSQRGGPLGRIMLWHIVRRCAERKNMEGHVSPHTLRHSFATHLLAGGAPLLDVSLMLGHESIVTTQRYTHVDFERLRAVHRKYHPRGK